MQIAILYALIFVSFNDKLVLEVMKMTIRPYNENDKEDVRFVCLNSEGPCKLSKRGRNFALAVYCDYYIDNEPENCFVAVDENDKAIGYVICAEDFDNFKEVYINEYYPKIGKWEYRRRRSALRAIASQEKYKADYPAHLHIDILPEYQHMGSGRKLMDALCDNLHKKEIKGVMFTVWHKNYNAIKFYEKYGFELIETKETSLVYGLKLK